MATRRSFNAEQRLLIWIAIGVTPAVVTALVFIWRSELSSYARLFLSTLLVSAPIVSILTVRRFFASQLLTLINLIEAIRLGDFSLRGHLQPGDSAMNELFFEVNTLADTLQKQRVYSQQVSHLIDRVIADIEVAILAFDQAQRLRLCNPAATRLMGKNADDLQGQSALTLGLQPFLQQNTTVIVEHQFASNGIWQIRHETYREQGEQHSLLFITDLQQVLRAEELKAWKHLIRVISHEVNNSLSPIASLSDTLQKLLPAENSDDVRDGLQIIQQRARQLTEFIKRYAELAKLPAPNKRNFDLLQLLQRLPLLMPQQRVTVRCRGDLPAAYGDPVLLEQLLINLLKNAIEAQSDATQSIEIHAERLSDGFAIQLRDHGPGIHSNSNLFVPFYTTKPGGAGIGLVLARQIADAHQGRLQLRNHDDGGCVAELWLPAMRIAV